jgi:hypothetical protein
MEKLMGAIFVLTWLALFGIALNIVIPKRESRLRLYRTLKGVGPTTRSIAKYFGLTVLAAFGLVGLALFLCVVLFQVRGRKPEVPDHPSG